MGQLGEAEQAAIDQRASLAGLVESIRSTPRVERTFNRAADDAVRHLEGYAQNIDQALSMIVRARELSRNRLGDDNASPGEPVHPRPSVSTVPGRTRTLADNTTRLFRRERRDGGSPSAGARAQVGGSRGDRSLFRPRGINSAPTGRLLTDNLAASVGGHQETL